MTCKIINEMFNTKNKYKRKYDEICFMVFICKCIYLIIVYSYWSKILIA